MISMNTKNEIRIIREDELHNRLRFLRIKFGYTQKDISQYLGVDVSTYAHYEKGDRTPNATKLGKLANLYHMDDDMLGAKFPIETFVEYKEVDKEQLKKALDECKFKTGDYLYNTKQLEKIQKAAEPIFKAREDCFKLPDVDVSNLIPNTTVLKTYLDLEVEDMINRYFETVFKLMSNS